MEQRLQALRGMTKTSKDRKEAELFNALADYYISEIERLKKQRQD
jgi:hypothetical protein